MGFLSKAWSGVKGAVKSVGDATGIDHLITSIPGSGQDAANAAKLAAIAAAIYLWWPRNSEYVW